MVAALSYQAAWLSPTHTPITQQQPNIGVLLTRSQLKPQQGKGAVQ